MDYSKLCTNEKIADSKKPATRVKSKKLILKKKLRDALNDTETTDEAVEVAIDTLQGQDPADAIAATVEVLGETIDKLDSDRTVNDSKKQRTKNYRALKKKLMDALQETESTSEAVNAAVDMLEGEDPVDVVSAAVEILSGVVDDLYSQVEDSRKRK